MRQIGIKRLRLINVDHGENQVVGGRLQASRLDKQLQWCKTIGASPHIIIGQGIPSWLSTHGGDPNYGPRDWTVYADYLANLFQHVILDQQFASATWEVGNEPETLGSPVPEFPRKGAKGSEKYYQSYLQLYRQIAQAAVKFEAAHPGIKITLGGPAGHPVFL
ncbi:MAG: hypothetical protein ACYDIC_01270 [Desulfobaccales bacterium]